MCDPVAHRAEQVATELGCRAMDGYRAVAACEDVDAILLLSARWFGSLPITAACEHSKAVYCGASVDLAADEARRLRDRVREAGVAFMAEFPKRLAPATIRLKELIATRLGAPQLLFCNQRFTASAKNGSSYHGLSNGASGPVTANMRHLVEMVDWCRYIVGSEATAVRAVSHATGKNFGDDYSLMMLDFEHPTDKADSSEPPVDESPATPMAQIACGSYVPPTWSEATAFRRPADLQVICQRGIAFIDLPNTLVWFDDAGQHTESLEEDRPIGEQLLMYFHRAVSSLVLPHANLDDAFGALSLVIAAHRSHEQGCRIELPMS